MTEVGTKIRLKKVMGPFSNIGEVCEIISVDDNIIQFKFGNGQHLGFMSEDEMEEYFDVVEQNNTLEGNLTKAMMNLAKVKEKLVELYDSKKTALYYEDSAEILRDDVCAELEEILNIL